MGVGQELALRDIGYSKAEESADGRGDDGVLERVEQRLPHRHLVEQHLLEVIEREIRRRHRQRPGLAEGGLQDDEQRHGAPGNA